jgi:hypothetical protein
MEIANNYNQKAQKPIENCKTINLTLTLLKIPSIIFYFSSLSN